MMEDDLVSCLTRQVKEDVVENYLGERRLIDSQIEEFESLAQAVRVLAEQTGKRFTRIGFLMLEPDALVQLLEMLAIPPHGYWDECLHKPFRGGVRFIQVIAFTSRTKFRKLVVEAYRRLHQWVGKYREAYRDLELECAALNQNILQFRNRFDLLTLLNFLKSLDVRALEQKHVLGENFSAEELSSVDQKLFIPNQSIDRFELPLPPEFSGNSLNEETLGLLAVEIYNRHAHEVRKILR